jgi:hypothetical protein
MNLRALSISAIGAALLLGGVSLAAAQSANPPANPPVRVRGAIEKVDGTTLQVKMNNGQDATVKLADNARVTGIEKAALNEVKVGTYVGISSMPQADGPDRAIHVHIFLDTQRGLAEGHTPWDNRPGAMMTNAAVETVVAGKDGETLTVKYKGTEKKIVVPPDAAIVKYVPGSSAQLVPGAKIFIIAAAKQPDGSLQATNVSVGLNGLTPPM